MHFSMQLFGFTLAIALDKTTSLDDRFEALNKLVKAFSMNPRSLTVSSPSPVQDAAKIMSDIAGQCGSKSV